MKLRRPTLSDAPVIWEILQSAIEQRRKEGSDQWQYGYPNMDTVKEDIEKEQSLVLESDGKVIAFSAVIMGDEPDYAEIDGEWLTEDGNYAVVHRLAVAEELKRSGIATKMFQMIGDWVKERGMQSIRVDTNFDNQAMLRLMKRLDYTYCGEVWLTDGQRRAFEKIL